MFRLGCLCKTEENHNIYGDHGDSVRTDGSCNCALHVGFELANETCLNINKCLSDGAWQLINY